MNHDLISSATWFDFRDLFLASKEAERRSPATVRAYAYALDRFLASKRLPSEPKRLTGDHLTLWMADLNRSDMAAASVRHYQRHVWAFIGWLWRRGDLERDPRRGLAPVSVPEPVRRTATIETVTRMLTVAAADEGVGNSLRDMLIVQILWDTGLRVSELARVTLDDLDLSNSVIYVQGVTKNLDRRTAPFGASTKVRALEYIARRRGKEPGSLLLTRDKRPMKASAIQQAVNSLAKRAGVQCSPHDLRRGFASRLALAGMDIRNMATLLGHRSLSMSAYYARAVDTESAVKQYRERLS